MCSDLAKGGGRKTSKRKRGELGWNRYLFSFKFIIVISNCVDFEDRISNKIIISGPIAKWHIDRVSRYPLQFKNSIFISIS